MISKVEAKKLDSIGNINNIYVVMDSHTILHTSENLLSCLVKKYGENRVVLNISIKDCEIPSNLEEIFNKKSDELMLNTA